ncbi:hypothetical protein DFH08DRAFT_951697 [Mycena albidolilacea]|uniref:HNH nuclease domain-containing protein n=1 Tax=Mycena albidolilacea TaxID=1033008 RepID=A0AAD7AK27_9AGAR|nr:hypothetical protein DFH08DRAFT_951697 [Mycena albidolilacea]
MSIFLAGGDPKPVKDTSDELDSTETVNIYHPGYSSLKLMLMLVAFEAPSGQRGIPFSVVLDACRILANNQDGTLRVVDAYVDLTAPDDDSSLLPPGHYTYRVNGGEACYAVCASFRAWTPPRVLPPHWDLAAMGARAAHPWSTASTYSTVVKVADGRCAVTGDVSRLENSRLVPEGEAAWWILRGMNGITNNAGGINSPPNCLALRADLNAAGMDKGHFVFAPYQGAPVCVCLTREVADFAVEYHLRAIKMPRRIHPMNVYVRFAWGLFQAFQTLLRDLSWDQSVVTVKEPNFLDVPPEPKRRRTEGNDTRRDEQGANAGGGHKEQGQEQDNADDDDDDDDDDSPQESSDDNAHEPPLDVETWTERDVEIAEGLDAELDGRPLAPYEEQAGMYRGYSKAIRLKRKYREQHPEVSAVRRARVARMGEDDDEQVV